MGEEKNVEETVSENQTTATEEKETAEKDEMAKKESPKENKAETGRTKVDISPVHMPKARKKFPWATFGKGIFIFAVAFSGAFCGSTLAIQREKENMEQSIMRGPFGSFGDFGEIFGAIPGSGNQTAPQAPINDNRAGLGILVRNNGSAAVIQGFTENSTAEQAGLQEGDIICAIDGHEVVISDDIVDILSSYEPGDVVTVEYERGGKKDSLQVTLMERENSGNEQNHSDFPEEKDENRLQS